MLWLNKHEFITKGSTERPSHMFLSRFHSISRGREREIGKIYYCVFKKTQWQVHFLKCSWMKVYTSSHFLLCQNEHHEPNKARIQLHICTYLKDLALIILDELGNCLPSKVEFLSGLKGKKPFQHLIKHATYEIGP